MFSIRNWNSREPSALSSSPPVIPLHAASVSAHAKEVISFIASGPFWSSAPTTAKRTPISDLGILRTSVAFALGVQSELHRNPEVARIETMQRGGLADGDAQVVLVRGHLLL